MFWTRIFVQFDQNRGEWYHRYRGRGSGNAVQKGPFHMALIFDEKLSLSSHFLVDFQHLQRAAVAADNDGQRGQCPRSDVPAQRLQQFGALAQPHSGGSGRCRAKGDNTSLPYTMRNLLHNTINFLSNPQSWSHSHSEAFTHYSVKTPLLVTKMLITLKSLRNLAPTHLSSRPGIDIANKLCMCLSTRWSYILCHAPLQKMGKWYPLVHRPVKDRFRPGG